MENLELEVKAAIEELLVYKMMKNLKLGAINGTKFNHNGNIFTVIKPERYSQKRKRYLCSTADGENMLFIKDYILKNIQHESGFWR